MIAAALFFLSPLTTTIMPNDPKVHLVGRFDRSNPAEPKCSWSATGVELRVKGTKLQLAVSDTGQSELQVEEDGSPTIVATLHSGDNTIDIPLHGSFEEVRVLRRTEPFVGVTTFKSMATDGEFASPKPPKRHIEVIGDSITCGYGDEGKNQNEHFSPSTENAYFSYASVAGREVGAEVNIIAWSGRKMWPDNTIPSIYDLTIPTDPNSTYDFRGPKPDAILINLATNDFGQKIPDEKEWTDAYAAFISHLRMHYPKAMIYPAIGSMMSDDWPPKVKALSTLRGYLTRMIARLNEAGDKRIKLIEFDVQNQADGLGADWHPSVKTHQKMGDRFAGAMRQDLGW